MKKTYNAPVLRTVEIGSEAMMTLAVSADPNQSTNGNFSADNFDAETSVWDSDSWSAADED